MLSQEAEDYIKKCLDSSIDPELIRRTLKEAGYPDADVEAAFAKFRNQENLPQRAGEKENIWPVKVLLTRTFELYKKRFPILLGIVIAPLLVMAISVFLISIGSTAGVILSIPFIFAEIFLAVVSSVALVYALKFESINILEAYGRGIKTVSPFVWINILNVFVIIGGLTMLIIPGFIFMIWLLFSNYILVNEGDRGMNAMLKSRNYVSGYFGPVALRLIVFILLAVCAYAVAYLGTVLVSGYKAKEVFNFISPVINLFLTPFGLVYFYKLYENFTGMKPEIVSAPPHGSKKIFVFSSILGVITPIVAIVATVVLLNYGADKLMADARDSQRINDLYAVNSLMGLYALDNDFTCEKGVIYRSNKGGVAVDGTGWIPIDFSKMTGGSIIASLPKDPLSDASHYYSFACDPVARTWEIDSPIESKSGKLAELKTSDQGNDPSVLEVGTDLTLIGPGTKGETDQSQTYRNDEFKFELSIPKSWESLNYSVEKKTFSKGSVYQGKKALSDRNQLLFITKVLNDTYKVNETVFLTLDIYSKEDAASAGVKEFSPGATIYDQTAYSYDKVVKNGDYVFAFYKSDCQDCVQTHIQALSDTYAVMDSIKFY